MSKNVWIKQNTASLADRLVAITGSTGGLGRELCHALASLGAALLLLDRNPARSHALAEELMEKHPGLCVRCLTVDLAEVASVGRLCAALEQEPIDVLILNAGAYCIPREPSEAGYDRVFQINYASAYYIVRRLLPKLEQRQGRVVAVGSIAHRYSETDPADPDFSGRQRASLVYGNAKRHLMFSLYSLFEGRQATLAVTHPGISFTNITAHYPKLLFALIKHPMKLIFMRPKKAALSILRGVFSSCKRNEWIGPALFDVWGLPKKGTLSSVDAAEQASIDATAEEVWERMCATVETCLAKECENA